MSTLRWTPEQFDAHVAKTGGKKVAAAPVKVGAIEDTKNRLARAMLDAAAVAKPTKYRNKPTTDADGVKHASRRQALRYRDLGLLMKSGEIMMLGREVRFRLPGGVEYRADHVYATPRGMEAMAELVASGDLVVEDVKSPATKAEKTYRMKKRQMRECLGVEIKEVS